MPATSKCFACLTTALTLASVQAVAEFRAEPQFGSSHTITLAWVDADLDGRLDLSVGNCEDWNQLFVNNGDSTFTELLVLRRYCTFALAWADFDLDGDPDVAIGNNGPNRLFVNQGNNVFTLQVAFGESRTVAMAWADFDLDGDLDLAVGNGILGAPEQNYLWVNNGDGTFSDRAEFGRGQTGSLAWADVDNDGDPDLAVGNGGFGYEGQNALYLNQGDGTFTERAEFGEGDTACVAWGDADNDGDLDLAVGNWNGGPSVLYLNQGDGTFTRGPQLGAADTNTLAWGDFDNDGDLDLAVGNGDFQSAGQNYLVVNNGDGVFSEVPEFGLGSTDAVAWGDVDGDGDLDLAVGNEHSPADNELYVNLEDDLDFLTVVPAGHRHDRGVGYSNPDGVGARVEVYETGSAGDPSHLIAIREIEAHGGFSPQGERAAHFGLPGRSTVDLRIVWPGSGTRRIVQVLPAVSVGQRLVVDEAGLMESAPRRSLGRLGR